MKTEAVKNEVLNFISLQPLFHYGGPIFGLKSNIVATKIIYY